jgi:3-methyladenine DNA glycosylase AlkD
MIEDLVKIFSAHSHSENAAKQSAYLRDLFPFVGITKPTLASLEKTFFKTIVITSEKELEKILLKLWEREEREYHYTAISLAKRYKNLASPAFIKVLEKLIRTKSWWDTVDDIASNLVGPLVQKYQLKEMEAWIDDPYLWIRRTALLYQLKYKEKTDEKQLFRFIEKQSNDSDFFIRKAIGWALREHSKHNPKSVAAFIKKNRENLSGLSIREGSKYLGAI